jgi:hypothetical protein
LDLRFENINGAIYKNEDMDCGSGFPAAISIVAMKPNRGWKAAPTSKIKRSIQSILWG